MFTTTMINAMSSTIFRADPVLATVTTTTLILEGPSGSSSRRRRCRRLPYPPPPRQLTPSLAYDPTMLTLLFRNDDDSMIRVMEILGIMVTTQAYSVERRWKADDLFNMLTQFLPQSRQFLPQSRQLQPQSRQFLPQSRQTVSLVLPSIENCDN